MLRTGSSLLCTCQLFLNLSVPCPPQEAHTLPYSILPSGFYLVGWILEDQISEGSSCCPLYILVCAAEQLNELGDSPQPIDLYQEREAAISIGVQSIARTGTTRTVMAMQGVNMARTQGSWKSRPGSKG